MIDPIQATHSTFWRALAQFAPETNARILFLAAAPFAESALAELGVSKAQIDCVQPWRPPAKALQERGYRLITEVGSNYDQVWILPGQHRDENRANFALALTAVREGGLVIAAMHNEVGAERFQKNFKQLFGAVESLSKAHCRAFWTHKGSEFDTALLEEWRAFLIPGKVSGTTFVAPAGGTNSQHIDKGSKIFSDTLATEMVVGAGADLGAGYGYLTHSVLANVANQISSVELVDADRRALDAALINLAPFSAHTRLARHWCDVCDQGDVASLPTELDWILMKAPLHQHRQHAISLGHRFITVAAGRLRPGGVLFMVANEGFGFDGVLKSKFSVISILAHRDGFKVFRAK